MGEDTAPIRDGADDGGAEGADRLCARVGCGAGAVATLTADYEGRVMAVGPLSPERQPPALDLCGRHAGLLSPPDGWEIMRHEDARPDG